MTLPHDDSTRDPPTRPRYRVPVGMPFNDEGRRQGAIISVLVHLAIIALLLAPIMFAHTVITRIEQGAGGAGPAGGGGGGRAGESGRESILFVRPTTQAATTPVPVVPPPVIQKIPPVVQPVTPPPPPVTKAPEMAAPPAPAAAVATTGAGTGTGADGTVGNGPGSGGGVGSGIGTGRGSGTGPGTGGGTQANYPPQPIEFFLPPLPPPSSVKGFSFVAEFDVDSTGKVLEMHFSPTRDGDYNRRLASVLRSMRFRPGTRPDGTPLRMKAQVGYEF